MTGATTPRVLHCELEALAGRRAAPGFQPWNPEDSAISAVGSTGGAALALALFRERQRASPFTIAVGSAVRRGLPTAVRATISARAPLTGAYADGQVGGELASRLARVGDALTITGRTELVGACLVVTAAGAAELVSVPELETADALGSGRIVAERFGPCASLRVGPAARNGLAFASLVAGTDPPSLVGRGGLGAALASTGLRAICFLPEPLPVATAEEASSTALHRWLRASPRLAVRAEGGTFELAQAFAARGDLKREDYRERIEVTEVRAWQGRVDGTKKSRHGCRGCPTPCGWVFHDLAEKPQGGRFSAVYAVGWNLGLEAPEDAFRLLAACDAAGVDAKEAGAVLATVARARELGVLDGPPLFGDREALLALLADVIAARGDGRRARGGAFALARELGVEDEGRHGIAVRPDSNLAVRLGERVSCRGAEPTRTHPFLLDTALGLERARELFAPFPLAAAACDPLDPRGKGRIVWWHENLTAAVDLSGFCAFSAASLLADGVCTLDELANAVAPPVVLERGPAPGLAWLAAGASMLILQREIDPAPPALSSLESPFDEPGMAREYHRWRGLEDDGTPSQAARRAVGTAGVLEFAAREPAEPRTEPERTRAPVAARRAGSIRLRAFGALARALGDEPLCVETPLTLAELTSALERERPRAASRLVSGGRLLAAAYRRGTRVAEDDAIEDGDVLDLVLVTSGG